MLKEIKRQCVLNRVNFVVGLAVCGGVALLNIILGNITTMLGNDTFSFPAISSLLFMGVGLFYSGLMAAVNTPVYGDMALKFGATRRKLFPAMTLVNIAMALLLVLVGRAWMFIDFMASRMWGAPSLESFDLPWYWLVLAAVGVGLIGTWIGMLLQRYGKKAFWVVFAVYMAFVLFGTRIMHLLTEEATGPVAGAIKTFAATLAKLGGPGIALVGGLLAPLVCLHIWLLARKAAAR